MGMKCYSYELEKMTDEQILRGKICSLKYWYDKYSISKYLKNLGLDDKRIQSCIETLKSSNMFINIDDIDIETIADKEIEKLSADIIVRLVARKCDYLYYTDKMYELLKQLNLSTGKYEACVRYLEDNKLSFEGPGPISDRYILNENMLSKSEIKQIKLHDKFEIVFDFIDSGELALLSRCTFVAIGIAAIMSLPYIHLFSSSSKDYDAKLVMSNEEYDINDIYAVYNNENVWFCTRTLKTVNEEDKMAGTMQYGSGYVDEVYYRDEIYNYIDLKTGRLICHDHEDNFYIENISSLYNSSNFQNDSHKLTFNDLENDISVDWLLSREPGTKSK